MLANLRLYSQVFLVQLKNNFVRETVYRTNFFTTVAVDLVWIVVEFSLFTVIYANVETLVGWTKPQVYFFLGVFFASDALFSTFFQRNSWQFSDLVNKGELDIILTKPIHPLFMALTRYFSLTAWVNVLLGFGIMIRYADEAGFAGGWRWGLVFFWLAFGLFAAFVIRFTFSIWIFWTERSWAMSRMYYQFFHIATKPDTIYPAMLRYVILTALPFAFIGSVPARALLHGLEISEYALLAGVLLFFATLNAVLWRKGLKRYQSASS